MGRIAAFVEIENPIDAEKRIECDSLVDTGASHVILPAAWRRRLGEMKELGKVDQSLLEGTVVAPCRSGSKDSGRYSARWFSLR
jgi:hypothetical protein